MTEPDYIQGLGLVESVELLAIERERLEKVGDIFENQYHFFVRFCVSPIDENIVLFTDKL